MTEIDELIEAVQRNHSQSVKFQTESGLKQRALRQIMLEVDEAIVCLDREEPNIPMALRRLSDILILAREQSVDGCCHRV